MIWCVEEGGGLSDVCEALRTYVEQSRAGDFLERGRGRVSE